MFETIEGKIVPVNFALVANQKRRCPPRRTVEWDGLSEVLDAYKSHKRGVDSLVPVLRHEDRYGNPRKMWSSDDIGCLGTYIVDELVDMCHYAQLAGVCPRNPAQLRKFGLTVGNWMIGCGEIGQFVVVEKIPVSQIDITLH